MKSAPEIEQEIILALIRKYEGSKISKPNASMDKTIFLNLEKGQLPEYDMRDAFITQAYNQVLVSLQKKGWVDLEWVKQSDELIARVLLIPEKIEAYYASQGKESKQARYQRIHQTLQTYAQSLTSPWLIVFFQTELAYVEQKGTCSSNFDSSQEKLEALCKGLLFVDQEQVEPMRVMSTRLYHDSKYFEKNIRERFCNLMRKIHPQIKEYLEIDSVEILEQCGILMHQELYEFCGPLAATYHGEHLSFAAYKEGACIKRNMALLFQSCDFHAIHQITLIENYTNYEAYIQKERQSGELVLYHGGFYSPRKAEFYILLEAAMPKQMPVRFWADIDYGGFSMFLKLKKIFSNLVPMRMDVNAYEQVLPYARAFSSLHYEDLLQGLLEVEEASCFHDVIQMILYHKKVIEQESFLINQG